MSRVGREPISIPPKVDVYIEGEDVRVSGPKGELRRQFRMEVGIRREDDVVLVERSSEEPEIRSLHGTTRTLISNMVVGVSDGWEKLLRIEGVGYRAVLQGRDLVLSLGFSHPVTVAPPEGIEFEVDGSARSVTVKGIDKELVGQVAANVRRWRPPEPYKGKGIRYQDENVRRKAGKAAKVEL